MISVSVVGCHSRGVYRGGRASASTERTLSLVLVGLLLAGECGAHKSAKKTSEKSFLIVFEKSTRSANDFPRDIYVMDQNGRYSRRLTRNQRSHNPSWSPDGHEIVFLEDELSPSARKWQPNALITYRNFLNGRRNIMRSDSEGRNVSLIASSDQSARDVFWFPDGQQIGVRVANWRDLRVFVKASGNVLPEAEYEESLEAFLDKIQPGSAAPPWVDPTLMVWVPPVENFLPTYYASWGFTFAHIGPYSAPDALLTTADVHSSLRVVSLGGTPSIFSPSAYDTAWSRDGTQLAYSSFSANQKSVLYLAGPQGTEAPRALTDPGLDGHGPAWSPNGSRIAFVGIWEDSSQIFLISADGSKLTRLSENPNMDCSRPSWSPDGEWIVAECRPNITAMTPFEFELGLGSNIFLFDVKNPRSKPRQLTRCPSDVGSIFSSCGARNPSFQPSPE